MEKGYEIRKISSSAIAERKEGMCFIVGGTFPNIPINLPIRRRAVDFIKAHQAKENVYICLHADECSIDAMFVFYRMSNLEYVICRCIGRRAVRFAWRDIERQLDYISEVYIREFLEDEIFFKGFYAFQ